MSKPVKIYIERHLKEAAEHIMLGIDCEHCMIKDYCDEHSKDTCEDTWYDWLYQKYEEELNNEI